MRSSKNSCLHIISQFTLHLPQGNKVLEVLVIFLRSCGMFQGLNNPLTGVCCMIAAVVNSPFNLLYLFWSVSWSLVWAYVLNLPRVLIKNGVCGAQGTILGNILSDFADNSIF